MREDAFLGIERLATEDLTLHESVESKPEARDRADDRDESDIGEEITSIEIGGEEETVDGAESIESEAQRKRRRRRRRGRRVKGRGEPERGDSETTDTESDSDTRDEVEQEEDEDRPQRRRRPEAGVEKRQDDEDEDDDLDDGEEGARPNKNLHREVTPWAEAIGYIVSANMEARAKSPGGGQRGRWGKGDRR
jgi:hypothetical protein